MKIKRLSVLILLISFICSLFCSCKGPVSDSELIEIITPLLEREAELCSYIYGDAFKTSQDPGDDVSSSFAKYYEVREDSKYRSIDALKEEINAVYTKETAEIISIFAFNGYTDESDGGASVTPRFAETKDGILQIDVAREPYDMRGIIHASTAVVKRSSARMIRASVKFSRFSSDGRETVVKKTLELKMEDGVWRLDSQTFARAVD